MEHRDYNYYEAHAATINLEGITSSAKNANILQRLRDGDYKLSSFSLGRKGWESFYIREDDDMGWLGYFIGKSVCLQRLGINYLPNGEEGHAFAEGIARSQSLRNININNLSNDGFTSVMRALHGVTQLEGLTIWDENNVDPDGWSELGTLLESGVCKVKQLDLSGNHYIGNEGMDIFSNGLRGIGSSLKGLMLNNDSIGNDGLLALVEALHTCTSLETLNLNSNDFSSAVTGLGSLSDWLQRDEVNLDELNLQFCSINEKGYMRWKGGATNQCRELNLDGNESITTLGLSYLSDSIRSNSCPVMILDLQSISIGDTGLEVLAQGLLGNQSLTCLYLDDFGDDISVTSAGWVAFSTALCDTSSVNSTYLSNHTLCDICAGGDGDTVPHQDISRYLRLNEEHPQYAARCKILMKHRHLDMTPFLHWGLKCLPLAVAWFERAKPCTSLTIYDYDPDLRRLVLDEADEAFESRELTAMYEFLHGMPLEVMKSRKELIVAAHDDNDEIAMIDERYREALEQRDRKIEQLEEEIMRLRGL